jgi:hypothetical protein
MILTDIQFRNFGSFTMTCIFHVERNRNRHVQISC